ncbi:tRNA (guanosine(46)-N7)-methyltransferase TrmB [Paenarthrobacter sp. Z7-10]|uniref:tRNA (guanosine(46)-N7)-methyltransferase TrmB n=1 Tax=Paenarthrobacter sp. Z7-10 TaxID=2787635 RepID=UPI0022A9BB49|nr:tRNA (guanosine(46)-N7)-methyltransferase TrmB [Paenarthrobacter sp. Z7-10]MCZ2401850.1 tRNA (guanosine(46)-N7)-methyltransferase TrmB [Paenarthrobacter sp. Z7-10]
MNETPNSAPSIAPPSNAAHRAQPVSFVRRGSRLQGRRQKAWAEHADAYVIDVPRQISDTSVHPDFRFDAQTVFGRTAPLIIEIGSGLGEAVVQAATDNPDKDFLAVEVYLPGLAQTLLKVAARSLPNVRLVQANAPEVLDIMVPAGSVSEVWVFFPDPWHKSKHEKRRLVTPAFAQQVAAALEPGGIWRLATDWEHYARQMRQIGDASPLFTNMAASTADVGPSAVDGGWAPRFEGRVLTSFESKAHRAGRAIHDLAYRRNP